MSKICIHTNKETTTKGVLHIVTFKFNIYPPHLLSQTDTESISSKLWKFIR